MPEVLGAEHTLAFLSNRPTSASTATMRQALGREGRRLARHTLGDTEDAWTRRPDGAPRWPCHFTAINRHVRFAGADGAAALLAP